jgi:chromosome segregation ATPase
MFVIPSVSMKGSARHSQVLSMVRGPSLVWAVQGRLPEIEVLQKQISQAHEEMSDLQFRRNEELAAASAKEQQLVAAKVQLEGQVSALKAQAARLEREAAAAVTRASQHEKQLEGLYELCQSQQGTDPRDVSQHLSEYDIAVLRLCKRRQDCC